MKMEGFLDYLKLIHNIDHMCNKASAIIGESYREFVQQYFELNFAILIFFKRNHPLVYPRIDILLTRIVKQVYDVDISPIPIENEEKIRIQKNKNNKFWIDEDEHEEIEEQMSSFASLNMVRPTIVKIPDLYDLTKLTDLLLKHQNYQSLKNRNYKSIMRLYWQSLTFQSLLEKMGRRILYTYLQLEAKEYYKK